MVCPRTNCRLLITRLRLKMVLGLSIIQQAFSRIGNFRSRCRISKGFTFSKSVCCSGTCTYEVVQHHDICLKLFTDQFLQRGTFIFLNNTMGNGKTALAVESVLFLSFCSLPSLPPLIYPTCDIGIIIGFCKRVTLMAYGIRLVELSTYRLFFRAAVGSFDRMVRYA